MTTECVVCGNPVESGRMHPAVEPGHCPDCLPLERSDAYDGWLGLPMSCEVAGVRFERSAFVMGGQWCLAGTRLPAIQIERLIRSPGEAWVRGAWPSLTDQQIAACRAFVSPAPALPAMRAEEV